VVIVIVGVLDDEVVVEDDVVVVVVVVVVVTVTEVVVSEVDEVGNADDLRFAGRDLMWVSCLCPCLSGWSKKP
jgi:hypothetical protein